MTDDKTQYQFLSIVIKNPTLCALLSGVPWYGKTFTAKCLSKLFGNEDTMQVLYSWGHRWGYSTVLCVLPHVQKLGEQAGQNAVCVFCFEDSHRGRSPGTEGLDYVPGRPRDPRELSIFPV